VTLKKVGDGVKHRPVTFSQAASHREAIVRTTSKKSRAAARPYRPSALTWVDFLVIVAIVMTFAAMASTTIGHATQVVAADPDLTKARIRLAIGAPWD
jgi:ABC-type uncharacterized transport system permease subunit